MNPTAKKPNEFDAALRVARRMAKVQAKKPKAFHTTHEKGATVEMSGARYIVAKDGSYRRQA